MSRPIGAADRALDLMQDHQAFAIGARTLTGTAYARVAGETFAQTTSAHPRLSTPGVAGDDVPDDTTSPTPVGINVLEGETIHSAIDDPTDKDFFVFQATAGETYQFTLTPDDADGTTGPDQLLQLVDAEGNVLQEQDGGGSGADEQITFNCAADGTYYISAQGYAALGTGGYSLEGKLYAGDPDPNSGTPLDAIDWGVQVDTDGVVTKGGDEVIHYYFCKPGEVSPHPITPTTVAQGMQQYEKDAMITSFAQYENIINVEFREVDKQSKADFIFTTSPNAPVLLGAMSPPGESAEGVGWFNSVGVGWDEAGLAQGGYGFITFTHELGHGMGLAHPHDNGGNSTVMNGVESDTDSGDYGLNQGVFTVMTYNDGWPDGPNGKSPDNGFGWSGTLMAMDIAVLQQKYGANMDHNTGNDTYTLWSENAPGTMYACIWDAGGKDTIAAGDALNVSIDLREATLKYEVGGGGYVSYANGVIGGYTVANGVKVENAEGGAGDDLLRGNDYRNRLTGGEGKDELAGAGGKDMLNGGAGKDLLSGGEGADRFIFASLEGDKILDLGADDTVALNRIDADSTRHGNQDFALVGAFTHHAGEAVLSYDAGRDITRLALDTDGDGHGDLMLKMAGDQTGFTGFTGFVS